MNEVSIRELGSVQATAQTSSPQTGLYRKACGSLYPGLIFVIVLIAVPQDFICELTIKCLISTLKSILHEVFCSLLYTKLLELCLVQETLTKKTPIHYYNDIKII